MTTESEAIEAGAKSLYSTSPSGGNYLDPITSWDWLTDAIKERWRKRFTMALQAYNEAGSIEP